MKIHIFDIFSKSCGPIFIKLVIHDPYDKDINSGRNGGWPSWGPQGCKISKIRSNFKNLLLRNYKACILTV